MVGVKGKHKAMKGNSYASKYLSNDNDTGMTMEEICDALVDFAENSPSIYFSTFCRQVLKKSKTWLEKTSEHYPELKAAIEQARDIMAQKIGDSCFRDKESGVNATFGEKYLAIYDKDYKAFLKWKAEISKEQPVRDEAKAAFLQWEEEQKNN